MTKRRGRPTPRSGKLVRPAAPRVDAVPLTASGMAGLQPFTLFSFCSSVDQKNTNLNDDKDLFYKRIQFLLSRLSRPGQHVYWVMHSTPRLILTLVRSTQSMILRPHLAIVLRPFLFEEVWPANL
jgi:hypothetical protein